MNEERGHNKPFVVMTSANTHQYNLPNNGHTRLKHVVITANPGDTSKQFMYCSCPILNCNYSNDCLRSILCSILCYPHKQTKLYSSTLRLMAHAQKPDFVFRRNGRVHLNRPGASVQSTTGSRGVRNSGSNAGYTMFRGNVKGTGYPLHSRVSPSLPLPWVAVCHHISTGLYRLWQLRKYVKFSYLNLRYTATCFDILPSPVCCMSATSIIKT